MKLCLDKQCRRSGQLLLFSEFPINRALRDGRGIYCLQCCRRRQTELRRKQGAKARRFSAEREAGYRRMSLTVDGLVLSKVYDAIQRGLTTRQQIHQETGLDYDSIGEALVELVFDCKAVKIQERGFHLAA